MIPRERTKLVRSYNPMPFPLIVDAHEDIAWNILTFGRDLSQSARQTRLAEVDGIAPLHNSETLLGWPEYQEGHVAVIFGTLFAAPLRRKKGDWDTQCYANPEQAHRLYWDQLDAYLSLSDKYPDKFRLIRTKGQLQEVTQDWHSATDIHPVGIVLLMEGAEGVRRYTELGDWWDWGVRIIGPAWAGTRFCGGTREPGPLTEEGFELLKGMAEFPFILDLSHMDERAVLQSLDYYSGPLIASHANAASLLDHDTGNRHLSDSVIHKIIARNGVIGMIPYCRFLKVGWTPVDGRSGLTLETVSNHIDHICQIAGNPLHVGIGSDFDGGFGLNAAPADVDTIADLRKLIPILKARGYTDTDVEAILSGNWLRHLQENLP